MRSNGPSPDLIDFDGYAEDVEGLGPGRRVVIWVRGCTRHCPGCVAPELWKPGEPTPVRDVISLIEGPLSRADGLTVTGGEPFEQAEAITKLVALLRQRRRQTEVLVYTGFRIEELQAGPTAWKELLSATDILIDGPFMEHETNNLIWRGSDNQRVHLLTPEARRYAGVENAKMPHARPMSVQMLSPTRYRLIGIPGRGDLDRIRRLLLDRGLEVVLDE